MFLWKVAILYIVITSGVHCAQRSDLQKTNTLVDLPESFIDIIYTALIFGIINLRQDCSNSNNASKIEFWLYTTNNPNIPIVINSLEQIDTNKPIMILIHGWGGNANIDYIRVIKDAYLKRYDCNVVSVNYEAYASGTYYKTYCYAPAIGRNIAKFICSLSAELNIDLSNLHVIGHSLGAQISGFVGQNTQKTCGRIGRITALDPAGPLYQGINKNYRLDSTDATFVDVIHTNQGLYGYRGNCGDVDFYPNCGYVQPGCWTLVLNETTSLKDIIKFLINYIRCNHQRSCYLFAESINNNSFYSTNCWFCGTIICLDSIFWKSHAYMGESCRSRLAHRAYALETNDKPPYALGPPNALN